MTRAALVFDEGPGAGLGHRRRMEALAEALSRQPGVQVTAAAAVTARADIVVVDSYLLRADDRERWDCITLAAVDDLRRDLKVDVVVDPNPGAEAGPHVSAGTVLAGAAYALVSPPLRPAGPVQAGVGSVLVATGATDVAGRGAEMAGAIAARLSDAEVEVVVGPWGSPDVPPGVKALAAPLGLSGPLGRADLVVCSGGVTLLEALVRGRPTVAVVLADNQRQAVTGAVAAGAAVSCPLEDVVETVAALACDLGRRRALSAAAQLLVDGRGPERVAAALVAALGA